MTRKFILAAIAILATAAVGSTAMAGTRVTGVSTEGTRVTGVDTNGGPVAVPDGSIFGLPGSIFGCIQGLPC